MSGGGRVASISSGLNAASRGELRKSSSSICVRNPADATVVRDRSASSVFCDTRAETSARFAISAAASRTANSHHAMRMRGCYRAGGGASKGQVSSTGTVSFITSRNTDAA